MTSRIKPWEAWEGEEERTKKALAEAIEEREKIAPFKNWQEKFLFVEKFLGKYKYVELDLQYEKEEKERLAREKRIKDAGRPIEILFVDVSAKTDRVVRCRKKPIDSKTLVELDENDPTEKWFKGKIGESFLIPK